jgi:hypothetical protein
LLFAHLRNRPAEWSRLPRPGRMQQKCRSAKDVVG